MWTCVSFSGIRSNKQSTILAPARPRPAAGCDPRAAAEMGHGSLGTRYNNRVMNEFLGPRPAFKFS